MIAKTIIVARVGGGEQKKWLVRKKEGGGENGLFQKKMFAMDRDVRKKEGGGG